jgi:hypothetical protein
VDSLLGGGFTVAGAWNVAALLLFAVLARSPDRRRHVILSGLTWALLLSLLAARSLGLD